MEQNAYSASDREWILTNGLGGYALGFGNMINKRKYNGLLIASVGQQKRTHILSSIEERIEYVGSIFYLDSSHYVNCIHPSGYRHMVKSWLRPYPCALYSSMPQSSDYLVFKEVFLFEGQNAVAIRYTNYSSCALDLFLRPKFALRDHHTINSPGTWDRISLEGSSESDCFWIRRPDNGFEAYGYAIDGKVLEDHVIYRSVYYPLESLRGYESIEDLISPCRIDIHLEPNKSTFVIFSTNPLDEPRQSAEKAEMYYKRLPLPADHPFKVAPSSLLGCNSGNGKMLFEKNDYYKILDQAARDFIIAGGDIVAGYPWFGVWSRDTLISLGGLKYLSDGQRLAVRILKKYGTHLYNGLLPNIFGEGGEGTNYDSIDAPLWYVLRCYEYAPQDKELFNRVSKILLHYLNDESHPFFVADDGLLEIRRGDHALTWMDAKVYDVPVTPRLGKPVEINALWYNALRVASGMARGFGVDELINKSLRCSVHHIVELAEKVKNSFQKFVGEHYLADRIENGTPVWEVRPNAVIALSLPFDLVDVEVMKSVWTTAREKLQLPYGLRTLEPHHPAFKKKYLGNQKQRDFAYHQGTVWPFLLLPFAKLTVKVLSNELSPLELKKELTQLIWIFRNDFMRGKAASVAEVWDGVDPSFPKGCPAQAWSVFALLEIENLLVDAGIG